MSVALILGAVMVLGVVVYILYKTGIFPVLASVSNAINDPLKTFDSAVNSICGGLASEISNSLVSIGSLVSSIPAYFSTQPASTVVKTTNAQAQDVTSLVNSVAYQKELQTLLIRFTLLNEILILLMPDPNNLLAWSNQQLA